MKLDFLTRYKEALLIGSGSIGVNVGSDLISAIGQIGEILADYGAFALALIAIYKFLIPKKPKPNEKDK